MKDKAVIGQDAYFHTDQKAMSYLDIVLCIPLIWGLYKGFTKGLIIQVASLLALILGIYGAIMFSNLTQELLTSNFRIENKYVPITSFAVTFIGIVIGVHFLGKMIEKMINMIALGIFNKLLGAVFGLLKMALLLSALVFVFEVVDQQLALVPQKTKNESVLYGPMNQLIPAISPGAKKILEGNAVQMPI